jgi:hypothetical protein
VNYLTTLRPPVRTEREKPTRLALDYITIDDRLQSRKLNPGVVKDYVGVLRRGDELPPVVVVRDDHDVYRLVDGHHRFAAHEKLGLEVIAVAIVDGTLDVALWMSWAANRGHGLRRTRQNMRRAILAAVLHPRWSLESDREIARHIGCDHKTVGAMRNECAGGEFPTDATAEESPSRLPSKNEILNACRLLARTKPEQARAFSASELRTVRAGYEPMHRLLLGEKTLRPGNPQDQEIVLKVA